MPVDSYEDRYLATRKFSTEDEELEYLLAKHPAGSIQRPIGGDDAAAQFRRMMQEQARRAGKPLDKEAEREFAALEEPWIDPTTAFTGGFAGRAGLTILQQGGRAAGKAAGQGAVSGAAGAVMDYPIGMATEGVEERSPWLALPFNVLAGLFSGATVENKMEKAVYRAFEKRGIKTSAEAIRKARQAIKEKILGGEDLDPISREVSDDLWQEMGGFGTTREPRLPFDEMPGFGREGFTARGTIPAEVDDYWNILGRREPPDLAGREYWEDVFGYRRGPAEEYMDIAGRGEGRTLGGTLDAEIEGFGRTGRPEPYDWPEMQPPERGPAADYMGVFGGEGKALRGTVETAYEDLWDVFGRSFVGHEPNMKPDKASVVLDPGRFPVHRVAVKDIGAIPESLQFKLDVNAEGIQKQLSGEWNDLAAGNLLLWESRDGKLYVANGHHRLELAKRLGVKEVNAQVIREADGFDVNAARRIAAESNILEGKGTIYDHAEFFRQNRGSYDPGLSERKGLIGRGFTIGTHASDDTYAQFRNRKISPDAAEAVSAAAPGDEALQRAGVKFALENGRAGYDEISHFVKALKTAPRVSLPDQPDMFGFDDSAIEQAKTLARAVSKIVGDLREDLNAVLGAAKRPERAKKLGVNVKDPEAVRAKIEDLRGQLEDWSKWYVNEDLVKKAHEAAGLKVPDPAAVADDIRRYHIRRELFDELEDLGRGVATFGGALERAGGVKTLGIGLRRDLIRSGSVNLRGQVVETAEDLAAVAQVYRDPRYETLRIVYLKGNRIVGHEGYTSRMPGFAAFPLRVEKALYEIQSRAGRLGADGFYLLHNHPGGAPSPSAQDLQFSRLFKEKLAKIQEKLAIPGAEYKGHVVIDSGKYGFIHPETHIPEVLDLKKPAGWTDELLSPEKEHHLLGIEVSSSESLARLGAILRTPREFATLLYLDARNRIRAIQEVPNKLLNNYQEASNYIRGRTREFGAVRVLGYTDDAPSLDHAQVNNLIYNNTLTDMAYADPRMQRGWSTFRDIVTPMQGWIAGRPASAYYRPAKVGEEIVSYEAGGSPSVRLPEDFVAKASAFLKDRKMNLAEVPELEINWDRIETPDDVRAAIDGMSASFPEEMLRARGYQSHAQTELLAKEMGISPARLIKMTGGGALDAKEVMSMRMMHLSSGAELSRLAARAASPMATEEDLYNFQKQFAVHYAIQSQYFKFRAEAGRALNAFRIVARADRSMQEQLQEIIQKAGGVGYSKDMARMMMDLGTPEQVSKFVRQAAKGPDMLFEAYVNALTSNTVSHSANMIGNTITALLQIPERWLAGKISRLTGDRAVAEGEAGRMLYAITEGMKDAWKLVGEALNKEGVSGLDLIDLSRAMNEMARSLGPQDFYNKFDLIHRKAITAENLKQTYLGKAIGRISSDSLEEGGLLARAVDGLGEVVRTSGKFLDGEDQFFKAIGYRMELHARAYRQAVQEGLEGERLAERIIEILDNPPDDLRIAGINAGRYLTFQQDLGNIGKGFQRLAVMNPWIRYFVPFVRTPANIMKFVGERTPLALLSRNILADIRAGGAERDLALARIALGTITMATMGSLAAAGYITGSGPSNREMRQALQRTGWQPHSIRIGDTYYSYNRLDPVGGLIGIAADIAELINQVEEADADDDVEKLVAGGAMAIAKNIMSKTYVRGIAELVMAVSDPDRYGEKFVEKLAGSLVPGIVGQAERVQDPTVREVNSMLDAIKARVPSWSESLPPRRNLWGEPVVLSGALGPDMVSPVFTSKRTGSAIDEEIVRNRVRVGMPSKRVFGRELTPEQYDRYVQLAGNEAKDGQGRGLRDYLEELVQSEDYRRQSEGEEGGRSYLIRSAIMRWRRLAQAMLLEEFPELAQDVQEVRTRRAEARRPAF